MDGLLRAWTWARQRCARLRLPRVLLVVRCCWRGAIEQDEVVDDDLDAGMAFASLGILPAHSMEPAGSIKMAAFGHGNTTG